MNLFGPLCATSNNLFIVIEIKLKCAKLGIEKLNIGFKGALIKINRNYIKDFDDFLLLISKNKKFSFKNDDQIAYKDEFPEDIKIEKIFTLINTIAGFLHDKN